ncbi:hypothetical protein MKW92_032008 [Papaver armeniacum]|nr:hypothetical protein MKW92_032008 [Papaver armeniacum]
MLTKFETKSNRVKGLSFHSKRPWILASLHSGVIQLWDYRMGTLIDRFDEHDGPVRGVHFTSLSHCCLGRRSFAGDDYKIKVWNYKMHRCLFTLLGHLDYIRTVQFHNENPWIVSASDDQTIRIWNWQSRTCVSVLTGHNHYVMCASFHPKEDLVVSASLDQTVRVWDIGALKKKTVSPADDILRLSQMNTDLFGGVDAIVKYVLEGHDRGVNWASFHPSLPLIVSGADDRQVKLWRMNDTKAWEVDTLRGHMNNVSCVMFHARQDIIVSNSEDKSIRTFRREHDRFWILALHPEMNLMAAGHDSGMIVFKLERERPAFSVSGDTLFYFSSQKDAQVIPIRRPGSNVLNQGPRTMSYSPTENAILICSDVDGGSYELYTVPKDSLGRGDTVQEAKRGLGGSAIFVAQTGLRFWIRATTNALPVAADAIFYAGTGNLLCRSEDRVVIFDLQQRLVLGDLQTPFVKYVIWSNDLDTVALLSKHAIIIASKKLVHRCTLHETIRVKSGAWDDNGVFIYTTLNHIKYCLPNGDSGIIRTLDVPIYMTKYVFKLALLKKNYDTVMNMIRNSQLCGQAMISYLQQKVSLKLHFIFGNIQVAVASAKEIDEKDHWYKLGVEALRQGNAGIVEYAYQRTKNFERLSFLYLITGNIDKLSKMLKIAQVKNDVMGQFHNALYLGDITSVHGLQDVAEQLAAELGDNVPTLSEGKMSSLLMPPVPIMCDGDWPLLRVMKGIFEGGLDNMGSVEKEEEDAVDGDWGTDLDIVDHMQNGDVEVVDKDGDLELPPELDTPKPLGSRTAAFVCPTPGMPVSQIWVQKSSLAGEHAAAGNFDTAMRLLSRQLGIKNFAPLKSMFIDLHSGSHMYVHAFASGWSESASPNVRGHPLLVFKFADLEERLQAGYKLTTNGKFTDALKLFLGILHTIPLIVVESRREVDEVKELVIITKEYVLGCQMELKRRETKDNPIRQQELAAYFTHCNLKTPHLRLALLNAMTVCYKGKNFNTAANFARRFLETNPTVENQAKTARQVLQAAERNPKDETQLNYDFRNPFVVCGATYVPIYRGQKDVACPYCCSRFVPAQDGQLCTVCDLSVVGSDASGLLCSPSQIR